MKIDLKKISGFISENRGMILYAIGTIATAIIGAKYGIDGGGRQAIVDISQPSSDVGFALNSRQMAIASLTKTALAGGWTAKDDALKQIYDIAKDDKDDYTRSYAIKALQKIADAGGWTAKTDAQKFITLIAKAGADG